VVVGAVVVVRVEVGVRDVVDGAVMVGSIGVCGGATTVFCCELFTMTRPMTSPRTTRSATAASIHNQRRELGPPGFGGSGGGWFGGPYCPVAYGL
jgi:hypothetical protein